MTARPLDAGRVTAREAVVTSRQGFSIGELRSIVEVEVSLEEYPFADAVVDRALVYRTVELRGCMSDLDQAAAIRNELTRALHDGPGVIVIAGAIEPAVVDRATEVFERIIAEEREGGTGGGDHYAEPGANDRLWNALEKLAVADPETFVDYYACDMIDLASLAWLGPGYQITAQVNAINPGGAAQMPHRDYHVGFMTDDVAEGYPIHAHRLSPLLTLQGGVAHCPMPPETGATMLLPHSHKYELGYLAWRRPELIEDERFRGLGAHVVFDALWGGPLEAALTATALGARVIHVGQAAGGVATVVSGLVRGKQLTIRGYSNFGVPRDVVVATYLEMVDLATAGDLLLPVVETPISGVASAWGGVASGSGKQVLIPG